jgi:hypothetical protein
VGTRRKWLGRSDRRESYGAWVDELVAALRRKEMLEAEHKKAASAAVSRVSEDEKRRAAELKGRCRRASRELDALWPEAWRRAHRVACDVLGDRAGRHEGSGYRCFEGASADDLAQSYCSELLEYARGKRERAPRWVAFSARDKVRASACHGRILNERPFLAGHRGLHGELSDGSEILERAHQIAEMDAVIDALAQLWPTFETLLLERHPSVDLQRVVRTYAFLLRQPGASESAIERALDRVPGWPVGAGALDVERELCAALDVLVLAGESFDRLRSASSRPANGEPSRWELMRRAAPCSRAVVDRLHQALRSSSSRPRGLDTMRACFEMAFLCRWRTERIVSLGLAGGLGPDVEAALRRSKSPSNLVDQYVSRYRAKVDKVLASQGPEHEQVAIEGLLERPTRRSAAVARKSRGRRGRCSAATSRRLRVVQ